jgi:hypothetical protein
MKTNYSEKTLDRFKNLHRSIALLNQDPTKLGSSKEDFWDNHKGKLPQDLLDAWKIKVETDKALKTIMTKYEFGEGTNYENNNLH